jgi:hypothetical protein
MVRPCRWPIPDRATSRVPMQVVTAASSARSRSTQRSFAARRGSTDGGSIRRASLMGDRRHVPAPISTPITIVKVNGASTRPAIQVVENKGRTGSEAVFGGSARKESLCRSSRIYTRKADLNKLGAFKSVSAIWFSSIREQLTLRIGICSAEASRCVSNRDRL